MCGVAFHPLRSQQFPPMPVPANTLPSRPREGVKGVTLADVARIAGVSKITASRALANPDLVTEKTRAKVLEAVSETGYVQNFVAAGFKSQRTRLIACLVPTIASGSAFLPAVQAMTNAFAEAGFQVLLGQRGYDPAREEALIDAAIARRPDGIVVTGVLQSQVAREKLRRCGVPVLEAWDMTDDPIDMLVGFSHYAAGQEIANYLHGRGRRRAALITTSEPRGKARGLGFIEQAKRLGMAGPDGQVPTHCEGAPSRMGHGRSGLARLVHDYPDVDALCCSTDLVALGALIEAQAQGIAVPGQLAIVGFGDLDFAADTNPALTTLRIDNDAIGKQAASCLLQRMQGSGPANPVQDFGFAMVERGSA
jgi:LacI family gluconate utilization system Gnt-I transcriptional repressor